MFFLLWICVHVLIAMLIDLLYTCVNNLTVISFSESIGSNKQREKKTDIISACKTIKKICHNWSPYAELESDLNECVLKHREEGIITRTNIRMRALQTAQKTHKIWQYTFKATAGWCFCFMNRNFLTLRQRTHIAQ